MKSIRFAAFALISLPAFAQLAAPRTVAAVTVDQPRFSMDSIRLLERQLDERLNSVGKEPIDWVGHTRGIYLQGYGVVLMAEFRLIATPQAGGLFKRVISPE